MGAYSCAWYAGNGTVLGAADVYSDSQNYLRCRTCRQYVKRRQATSGDDAAKPVAGAAGGALLGWAVLGPPGALVGALLGLVLGSAAANGSKGST